METIWEGKLQMKIGINVTPLHSGHRSRGIGYYTKNLLECLKEKKDIDITEFRNPSEIKDVAVIHYPWFDFYFHTLWLIKSYPVVVTVHDVIPLKFPKQYPVGLRGKINLYLQKHALKKCKAIITDSLVSKEDIIKYLKIEEKKVFVVPLATGSEFRILKDTELLLIKRKYNLPEKFLMYTGDANWIKNLPFLIDCFSRLIKNPQFSEVKLVLIGGVFLKNVENINHPELESLKQLNRKIK
ncbi:MAG: glycosyltransferase, partial [Candidatus Daviesbacteria bacterium]|nr:glycosyltransferase [Candidatus Daviesbacteria bacterium]